MKTPTGWLGRPLIRLDEIDSTNDELWRRVRGGTGHGTAVVAARQTGGRGRQGRSWVSATGSLFLSWYLHYDPVVDHAGSLPIASGVAMARVLDALAPGRVRIKWPNDLLLDGRKVAGLLLESRVSSTLAVVCGLGVNLRVPDGGWGDLAGRAIALEEAGIDCTRDELLDRVLAGLEPVLDDWLSNGVGTTLEEWPRWSALDGETIHWHRSGVSCTGRVIGLAVDGGLRVEGSTGELQTLHAGEVHLGEEAG